MSSIEVVKSILLDTFKWFGSIIGLAFLFYITARLGLILAIPPGYATAIWLPSGISLAFILLFGNRVAGAIWVGSFLVNYQMSGNILIAGSIGLGSTLQALLGAYLVRKFVGFPNPLNNDKEIFGFLLLGGPVSCVLAATWGCSTLLLANQIIATDFLYNWFTWWAGDTIGVLVFTPFILIWTAEPREVWRERRLSLALPLCIMFSILIAFFMYTSRWKDEKIITNFDMQAKTLADAFEAGLPSLTNEASTRQFIDNMLVNATSKNMVLRIYDVNKLGNRNLQFSSSHFRSFNGLEWDKKITDANHQWLLKYTTAQNYLNVNQSWEVWVVPFCGVLLTGLLGALLLSVTGKAAMIEGVVTKRTTELRLANESLLKEIQQRQFAEASLALHTKELARSNAELEQFAYIASHDLREPLRMVVTYLQLLEREQHNQLDKNAKDYIGFAVDGAKRMQALISDLLTYSRIGTHQKKHELIDGEKVLKHVLDNLKFLIEESGAHITYDPIPYVVADNIQLGQLFQNLISNAIKFSDNKSRINIHIGVKKQKQDWLFSVEDNGLGISSEHFSRIFEIFQRLHPREKCPGTGIGLAVCKKIVEQHSGLIWVESTLGKGSIFFFTLPIPKVDDKAS